MMKTNMLKFVREDTQRKKLKKLKRLTRMIVSISLDMKTLKNSRSTLFGVAKTEALLVLRRTGKNKVKHEIKGKTHTIQVAGQELRIVEQYKHMGSMCTPSGAIGPEVSWRVDRSRVAYFANAEHFFGAATFSLKYKKSATATLLETRLSYSSETWPPLPMWHGKRLEGGQMRWIRKSVRKHGGEGCRETDAQIRAEFSIGKAH